MYLKSIMELWRTTTSRAWRMSYITFSKDTTRCPCRSNAMLLKLFSSRSVEPPSASRELFVLYLSSSKWTGTHKAIIFFYFTGSGSSLWKPFLHAAKWPASGWVLVQMGGFHSRRKPSLKKLKWFFFDRKKIEVVVVSGNIECPHH